MEAINGLLQLHNTEYNLFEIKHNYLVKNIACHCCIILILA